MHIHYKSVFYVEFSMSTNSDATSHASFTERVNLQCTVKNLSKIAKKMFLLFPAKAHKTACMIIVRDGV